MKNKFLNLIIINRENLKNKWWHRLASVLINGSTALIIGSILWKFIIGGGLTYMLSKNAYGSIFTFFIFTGSITLGWFIFWESIVYRVIIYIIYGPKK